MPALPPDPQNAARDEYLLDRILPAITASQIASFGHHLLREGKAPATVNRHLAVLSAVLHRAARDWGVLAEVPSVPLLKLRNEPYRWLTEKGGDAPAHGLGGPPA